jgi:cell division transport system permease protein
MRIRLVFSEAARSIWASASTTVAATITVLIGMFLLGLAIALGTWALSWSDYAKDKLLVKVYFCTQLRCDQEATAAQINATRIRLLETPGVKSVEFVSKAEALEIMEKRSPELVEGIPTNPLPHAFTVTPANAEQVLDVSRRIRAANLPGVERVDDGKKVADRILQVAKWVFGLAVGAVAVLLVASTLLIGNTIRLSIFSRRREIEVMKLVGATNWFVRGPFMIEGIICGLLGSIVAVVLLAAGKAALSSLLDDDTSGVQAIDFVWTALILVAAGLVLGAAGSGLTLRRFLRV